MGYPNIENILLATLDDNEKITVYERNNEEKIEKVLEEKLRVSPSSCIIKK